MEDRDKITEQFRNTFQKSEAPNFDAMDKVWNRVEEKLDKKVLRKENKLWKKIAVAATILLFMTLGYQFLISDKVEGNNQNENNNEIVSSDTISNSTPEQESVVSTPENRNPMIKDEAPAILRNQIQAPQQVAVADSIFSNSLYEPMSAADDNSIHKETVNELPAAANRNSGSEVEYVIDKKAAEPQIHKSEPLVVVDGKTAQTKYDRKGKMEINNVDPENVEELVVLNEPLYIINGVHYSELDLFGPNPTSPYAPLNQQDIESISVLQGNKAIEAYGEKGKKGVVIIITKTGKPKSIKGK